MRSYRISVIAVGLTVTLLQGCNTTHQEENTSLVNKQLITYKPHRAELARYIAQERLHTQPLYSENYSSTDESGVMLAGKEPLSTFSIDVDTASYANVRRILNAGNTPPSDEVRIEEFINYFSYDTRYRQTPLRLFQLVPQWQSPLLSKAATSCE